MGKASVAIVGPTACGKTRRAVTLARELHGEIISADSRQVYRGMTIGTGKDLEEYCEIPYHLIDIADAGEKYNLHRYLKDFHRAYDSILERGRVPVVCGGTGMYVENAIRGVRLPDVPENRDLRARLGDKTLDELTAILSRYKSLHNTTDTDTVQRALRAIEIQEYYRENPDKAADVNAAAARPIDCVVIGLDIPRDTRRQLITRRLHARLEEGMVDEIKGLIEGGVDPESLIYYGLEYKFVTLYVTGRISYDEMVHDLETAIHQFAKRQMTWFRGMEKRGTHINWLPFDMEETEFLRTAKKLME